MNSPTRRSDSRRDASEAACALSDLEAAILAARRASGLLDFSVLAARASREAQRLVGADVTSVALVQDHTSVVMLGAAGARTPEYPTLRWRILPNAGLAGTVIHRRKLIYIDDYPNVTLPSFQPLPPALRNSREAQLVRETILREGIRGLMGVPIEHAGEVVGLLYVGTRSVGHFHPRERLQLLRFSELLGPQIAVVGKAHRAMQLRVDEERERIAFDLHDSLGQILFAIGATAQKAQQQLPGDSEALRTDLERIQADASRAAAHLRAALRSLGPVSFNTALSSELGAAVRQFTTRTGVPAEVVFDGQPLALSEECFQVLLAVAREALHNAEKYAGAQSVVVTLSYAPGSVEVVVQDDGCGLPSGFTLQAIPANGRQWGLASLERRLARLGGWLQLISGEDGGLTVRGTIPAPIA